MKLRLEDITDGTLEAGMHDRFLRFFKMIPDEGFMIVYDPEMIGTGIRMLWNYQMRQELRIQVPGITTGHDIDLLNGCARRVMKRWHAHEFIFEGKEYKRDQLDEVCDSIKGKTAEVRSRAKETYRDGVTLVHGALWPITIETDQLREMDEAAFASHLNRLQSMDCCWCSCHVYISDDHKGYQGVYTITAGVDTIIPKEPVPPFGMIDPETGDAIVCDSYYAKLVTQHSRRTFLQTGYRQFLELIHARELVPYDASHYILPASMEDIIVALAAEKGKE